MIKHKPLQPLAGKHAAVLLPFWWQGMASESNELQCAKGGWSTSPFSIPPDTMTATNNTDQWLLMWLITVLNWSAFTSLAVSLMTCRAADHQPPCMLGASHIPSPPPWCPGLTVAMAAVLGVGIVAYNYTQAVFSKTATQKTCVATFKLLICLW